MAHDAKRSRLSVLDANLGQHQQHRQQRQSLAANGSIAMNRSKHQAYGSAASSSSSSMLPPPVPSARHSMIPRQSFAQGSRMSTISNGGDLGIGTLNGAGARASSSRQSLAPHARDYMDMDQPGQQSTVASTPYRQGQAQSHAGTKRPGGGSDAYGARQSVGAARMSIAPTPSARKSMSMGRVSLAPGRGPKGPVAPVDPRPLREDRHYLARMETDIQDFLADTGFQFPPKYGGEFHMPSYALVLSAFRHIYHECIDLKYAFNAEPRKEVEEMLQLLSDIRYPLIMDLSKTKLAAPGSIHNWPPVCGMLHWMIALESSLDRPITKYHGGPLERPVSTEDEDFCHYFPYLWRCYELFWDSLDEYPEEQAKLEKIFEEKAARAQEDLVSMRQELLEQESRLSELLDNDSPLEVETKEKAVLESDVKKFIEYRDTVLLPRIQQYRNAIDKLGFDSKANTELIQQRTRDRDRLRKEVDAQAVSADDFETMSREREALAKQLEEIVSRLHDKSSTNSHQEVSLSNKQARIEDELKTLSDRCREAGVLPISLADGKQFFDFELAPANAATMLPEGLDLKHDLRRRIHARRETIAKTLRETSSSKAGQQREFDELLEDVETQRDDMDQLEKQVRDVREQADFAAATHKEESRVHAEREAQNALALAQIDQAGRTALDQTEGRVQTATLQLNVARERDVTLRKQLHDEYVTGLETVLSLKSVVAEGLKSLQETAQACAQD